MMAWLLAAAAFQLALSEACPPQGAGRVEGEGIAAKYPGDEGIERDPRVLFVEDFETGDVKEIGARWGNVKSPQNMDLPEERHAHSPGKRSLHVTTGPGGPKGT